MRITEGALRRIVADEVHRLLESADGEMEAARAAAAALGAPDIYISRSRFDGRIEARGFGPRGSTLIWDPAAGRWRDSVNLTPGPFTEKLPTDRKLVVPKQGPFLDSSGGSWGYNELLRTFSEFANDSGLNVRRDRSHAVEALEDFLRVYGLVDRVSKEWQDAAQARLLRPIPGARKARG